MRLVAVLGYSDGSCSDLHPLCAARLSRAAEVATPDDVILFSGWARTPSSHTEADLMAGSWTGPGRVRLVDRDARTTLGNARAVARAARMVEADEVVLVTSRWHAARAATLARAALGSRTRLRVVTAAEPLPTRRRAREAGAWLITPVLALVAARSR